MQKGISLFQKYRQNKKLKLKSNLLLAATGSVLDLLPGEPCPTSSRALPLFDGNTPSPLAAVCSLTFSGGGTSGASLPFLPPARTSTCSSSLVSCCTFSMSSSSSLLRPA